MTENFTIHLPKATEKKLLARYDTMLQKAIEKAFEDQELYNLCYECQVYVDGLMYQLLPLSNGNVKACPTWSLME